MEELKKYYREQLAFASKLNNKLEAENKELRTTVIVCTISHILTLGILIIVCLMK